MLLLIQKSVGPSGFGGRFEQIKGFHNQSMKCVYASREVEAPLKHVNIRAESVTSSKLTSSIVLAFSNGLQYD